MTSSSPWTLGVAYPYSGSVRAKSTSDDMTLEKFVEMYDQYRKYDGRNRGSERSHMKTLLPTAGAAGQRILPLGPRTASFIRGGPHASDVYLQIVRRPGSRQWRLLAVKTRAHLKRQKTVWCRELFSLAPRQGSLVAETSLSATHSPAPHTFPRPRWRVPCWRALVACANHGGDNAKADTAHPYSPLRTAYMTRTTAPHVARSHRLLP
jgi:hypothetical protein